MAMALAKAAANIGFDIWSSELGFAVICTTFHIKPSSACSEKTVEN